MEQTVKGLFVAAWNDCRNPELDGTNPHFRNRYATLGSTLAAVREACAKHGIAYVQRFEQGADGGTLRSCVVSPEGEELALSSFPVAAGANPQAFGSGLTYAKRQQAQADWGITGDEDDDAEAAAQVTSRAEEPKRPAPPRPDRRRRMLAKVAEHRARLIEGGLDADGLDSYLSANYGAESPDQLSDEQLVDYGRQLAAAVQKIVAGGEGA